jgi:hypothetical protein
LAAIWAAALAAWPGAAAAQAGQDKDLDLIPTAPPPPVAPASAGPPRSLYVEDALSAAGGRGGLIVPSPSGRPAPWLDRLFADLRTTAPLADGLNLTLSGRANARAQRGVAFAGHEAFRLDVREAYLSWAPQDGRYLDVGRINLKSGVALGYNPTDVFKTRAVVDVFSSDPSALREDRLGALMVRGQAVWPGAALTVAYAPRLYRPTPIYSSLGLPTLDPMFDRTNAHHRLLVKASVKLTDDLSPEALAYAEGGRTRFGLNLTASVGRSVVLYGEWAGGGQADLIAEALAYGRATGSIPAAAPAPLAGDPRRRFRNDLSVGASYTTPSKIVFNLEYHLHEAGFSRADWRRWFAAGEHAAPGAAAQLWYIRGYAADQQEPAARHTAFLRVDRTDAFVRNLELSGFVNLDVQDGSGLAQAAADYFLSDRVTIGGLVSASFGGRRTDFGSSPQAATALVKLARYF